MTFEPGTVLEFFAGIGLARMGLERAGWRVVFANDIDPKKKDMHDQHWGEDSHYVLKSVFDLDPASLPLAEMAWASSPCVDLSLAGNRAGLSGSSSSAYWGFFAQLEKLGEAQRPPLVVVENVHGMLTSRRGEDLAEIVAGLNRLGYRIDIASIDASHFVPQSRPRLFVVGAKAPYAMARDAAGLLSGVRTSAINAFIARHPSLNWGEIPSASPPSRELDFGDIAETFPADSDIWWPQAAVDKLVGQMSSRHFEVVRDLANHGSPTFLTVYKRVRSTGCMAEVRFDGLAGCLRTPRGGSSRQFVLQLGRTKIRARHMTAIEYGRLQGAEEFRIHVPTLQALYGFGDAVCVPAVEWLARQVLQPLRPASAGVA